MTKQLLARNRRLRDKIRPKQGFAHFLHLGLVAFLPPIIFVLVRLDLVTLALIVVLLSKWRIFAVRPHHWLAHLRTNAVDFIFSLSILAFMTSTSAMSLQLLWAIVYEVWILFIKPGESALKVSLQAFIAQLAGLAALFVAFPEAPLAIYIITVGLILYFSARHFFNSFEEEHYNAYSYFWALFGASLTWVLGHWLLFYGPIAQVALLLTIIGYGLAALYYLTETDKLSALIQREIVFIMIGAVVIILLLSEWGSSL